jgi:hypothetical protein
MHRDQRERLLLQLEALSVLADEQALHLLPPLSLLPGAAHDYLKRPVTTSTQAGPLERCLGVARGRSVSRLESGDADAVPSTDDDGACRTACSADVPIVLHRLARACFGGAVNCGDVSASATVQQQALLCSVLQRGGLGVPGATAALQARRPLLARLLGMLLRWDLAAGQPSDAVPEDRLSAVQLACKMAGIDLSELLRTVLEA